LYYWQRCGDEAKALLAKTYQTSWSQNFVLQIYIFTRQNEVLAGLNPNLEPTKRTGRLCFIRRC
jgi:hypothetical protein